MDKVNPIISSIPVKLDSINAIVAKRTSISYFDTIKLAKQSSDICGTINSAIAAYKGFKPNDEEAHILLEEMTKIVELTEQQLALMIETKPVFEKLWVAGVVKKDIAKLNDASAKLSKTMMTVAPEYMRAQSEELEFRRGKTFEKAMSAYAGST
ncbi:hypothetical protein ACMFMG_008593 [Clarireedia jacksonii]